MNVLLIVLIALFLYSGKGYAKGGFVETNGIHLIKNDKPYYYIGTNMWYAAIMASEGSGGNRKRLCEELDSLKAIGVENLRILVGADGIHGIEKKAEPTLQQSPGVYNDTILAGLDYLLCEMGKRNMQAVLYLNNSWSWSGGYGYYLQEAGAGKALVAEHVDWATYCDYSAQFSTNTKAQQLFFDYVRFIVSRKNRYTGKPYTKDPAIMSWQIGNEPRAFSKAAKDGFFKWIIKTAQIIKSIDKNHLVSVGSEGLYGCEVDMSLFDSIHANKNIDYLTLHIWPYNWKWVVKDSLIQGVENACTASRTYLEKHLQSALKLQKPVVLEEFGYPRDGYYFDKASTTQARNQYYTFVFNCVIEHAKKGGPLAGCNFWGWSGSAQPTHEWWRPGDEFTNDPPQEPQGLYSVYGTDSTIPLIREYTKKLGF